MDPIHTSSVLIENKSGYDLKALEARISKFGLAMMSPARPDNTRVGIIFASKENALAFIATCAPGEVIHAQALAKPPPPDTVVTIHVRRGYNVDISDTKTIAAALGAFVERYGMYNNDTSDTIVDDAQI